MGMTLRENANAVLHYENYDKIPVVHFGFWKETLHKWAEQGHITKEEAESWEDTSEANESITKKLGFDFNWGTLFNGNFEFDPPFEQKILDEQPDGTMKVLNPDGVIVMKQRGVVSIPTEVDHYFKGRKEWEELFREKLQYSRTRFTGSPVPAGGVMLPFESGGLSYLQNGENRTTPLGLYAGSLIGFIRNFIGVENLSYLTVDDPDLLEEVVVTVADLCCQMIKEILETGAQFDYLHFWEDICYKNGPLISPGFFRSSIAPQYERITSLAGEYGIDIVSVDCDGMIDHLLPIWLEAGVNTMFPIEVGTWNASIAPWREQYGKTVRGVGGMNKTIFSKDRKAIEDEVERQKPLIDLGGYIPCPDHRIALDAEWDNVRYYCDLMQKL